MNENAAAESGCTTQAPSLRISILDNSKQFAPYPPALFGEMPGSAGSLKLMWALASGAARASSEATTKRRIGQKFTMPTRCRGCWGDF